MTDYIIMDNSLKNKALILLEGVLVELERLKLDRIIELQLYRFFENLILEIGKIETCIAENPRFDWVSLQNEIDELYANDKNLNGVVIQMDWKEGASNRAIIKRQILRRK
jgi:hypothetical protein